MRLGTAEWPGTNPQQRSCFASGYHHVVLCYFPLGTPQGAVGGRCHLAPRAHVRKSRTQPLA